MAQRKLASQLLRPGGDLMTSAEMDKFVQDYGFCPQDCDPEERAEARIVLNIDKGERYGDTV